MKKLTKKQEKQLRAVDGAWQKAGNIDLRIIILFVLSILDNKLEETLKRIENGDSWRKIVDEYSEEILKNN